MAATHRERFTSVSIAATIETMNFHVHFDPTPEGYTCTVRALVNSAPSGPVLAEGTGASQWEARDAAMAATSDPEVQRVLKSSVPDE